MIGLKRAMGMLLTGRQVTAAEGVNLGFVNEVASEDLMARANAWASEIAACSPLSIRATKHVVLASYCSSLDSDCSAMWSSEPIERMLNSKDAIEGPRAFVERRSPIWTNS
jgi:crotonobetainyl-CoA hydratase